MKKVMRRDELISKLVKNISFKKSLLISSTRVYKTQKSQLMSLAILIQKILEPKAF